MMNGKGLSPAPVISADHKRDAYGFAVRPQHLQRYREYASIYKEEEEERSNRWKNFLERHPESGAVSELSDDNNVVKSNVKPSNATSGDSSSEDCKEMQSKVHHMQIWMEVRSSLRAVEDMMSSRVKKKVALSKNETRSEPGLRNELPSIEEAPPGKGASEEDSDEEFFDLERSESDPVQEILSTDGIFPVLDTHSEANILPWTQELECLVQGGVPMELRGELWQAFVGVRARRVENYYQNLLSPDNNVEKKNTESGDKNHEPNVESVRIPEKWKTQIEKDLPRTFPGHPALDEDGRNALRRLLTAYARHNPSVGYCQAMNFFAGLLLLLMPEENAFWTLIGILDDYFDGYYTEEMIESQVDQLVLEELVRERFPKLVNHLDYLGVQVAWVTGPWLLTIFVNMLPWESVLRVWDVLLFEGNRVMLFRTALALMELYGPALVTTKDAGDAVTLLQSLAGSTFDSSQLVLTACMAFQNVQENLLRELRDKHRPAVMDSLKERAKGVTKDSQGLASKLYSFSKDSGSVMMGSDKSSIVSMPLNGNVEIDSAKDLEEQVVWLKVELCKLLEEKRSAEIRAEELETALMEMVKQDNRRQLHARVEQLEQQVSELKQALADKQEQESAMLQILMRVEQEQKVTEDARIFAEQDAASQRYAAQVLQEKYEELSAALGEMEKRALMAESMLEATLQYQSAQPSPRSIQQSNQEPSQETQIRKISLLSRPFGLGWRDRNKVNSENLSLKLEEANGNGLEEKL
ncbi:Ypt/Rab-GAP domain of gyp1p superfamily protein [Striga hermonthica]|uniref:Ypt/Rab-GAP domain of gyp1p superfamily protein n=1 Tax=Striga hermonthica TaxID=68872 RepID=A0A9N7R702_STRHE|nr:Ypt/Rab-GAP domain of gyp1p superfamily protein [Striga hermonthica]